MIGKTDVKREGEIINASEVSKTVEEIELEVLSALESLVDTSLPEKSAGTFSASVDLIKESGIFAQDDSQTFAREDFLFSPEYLQPRSASHILDYNYSSSEQKSFYDSENEQEVEIREKVAEEIKSQKIANSLNIQRAENGDASIAKKTAQELYKMVNFTMNTILYDLAEC